MDNQTTANNMNTNLSPSPNNNNGMVSSFTRSVSSTAGESFKRVLSSISSALLPHLSEDIIRNIVIENMPPGFIKEFNEQMKDPNYRREVDIAVENIKEYYNKLLSAVQDPFNRAVDNITDNIIPKLVGSMATSASTAVFNIANAIPGVGAVLSAGRVLNNITDTASKLTGSVSNTAEALNAFAEATKSNLNNLNNLQKGNRDTTNRVAQSMEQFNNPTQYY